MNCSEIKDKVDRNIDKSHLPEDPEKWSKVISDEREREIERVRSGIIFFCL